MKSFGTPGSAIAEGERRPTLGDKTNKLNIYLIREEPSWLKDFFLGELSDFKLFTAGAKGLLLVSIPYKGKLRIFAVVFGHGRHLLNDGVTEERFGLKVVLNSVDPKNLRSIDKTTFRTVYPRALCRSFRLYSTIYQRP